MHHDVELSAALWRVSDGEAAMDDALHAVAAGAGGVRLVACPSDGDPALRGRANAAALTAVRLWHAVARGDGAFDPALCGRPPGRLCRIGRDPRAGTASVPPRDARLVARLGRDAAAMRLPMEGRGPLVVFFGVPDHWSEPGPRPDPRAMERMEAGLRALGRAAARMPRPVTPAPSPRPGAARWCAATLGAAYGLTPREAQVALGLLAGRTPDRIGARCGIKAASVRMYLKRVYEKTMTGGQVDLIATLAGTAEPEG